MNFRAFNSVVDSEKNLKIKDFKSVTKNAVGIKICDNVIMAGIANRLRTTSLGNISPYKLFNVNGEIILLSNSGKLYKKESDAFTLISDNTYSLSCDLFSLILEGKREICITENNEDIEILNSTNRIKLFNADKFIMHDLRIMGYKDNKVICGREFDYNNESTSLRAEAVISIDDDYGKIIYMYSFKDRLAVVLTRGICTVQINGNGTDFSLKKETLPLFVIAEKTVQTISEKIWFINNKKLCCYDNTIYYKDTVLDDYNYTVEQSFVKANLYLLKVVIDNKNYIFYYDTLTNDNYLIDGENLMLCDGGYTIDIINNKLGELSEDTDKTRVWKSKTIDFESDKIKCLTGIKISSENILEITVKGDFGECTFNYLGDKKRIKTMLLSKDFTFTISGTDGNLKIDYLTLYYKK